MRHSSGQKANMAWANMDSCQLSVNGQFSPWPITPTMAGRRTSFRFLNGRTLIFTASIRWSEFDGSARHPLPIYNERHNFRNHKFQKTKIKMGKENRHINQGTCKGCTKPPVGRFRCFVSVFGYATVSAFWAFSKCFYLLLYYLI